MLQHGYAEVNGVRLHYVTQGEGKLIMFVHGFPEFWYEWRRQLDEFGKDYKAVALDMRGYNLSSKPIEVEQYRMRILTEDIRQLVEHLGHKRFILVAHDLNGVAYVFAHLYPDYLEKFIAINVPHPSAGIRAHEKSEEQVKAHGYVDVFKSSEAERILSENNYFRLIRLAFTGYYGGDDLLNEGHLTEEDLKLYIESWSQPGGITGGLNHYRALDLGGIARDNLVIRVPTLVIWGMKDPAMLPGYLDGLEKFVPGVTIKRIPDAAHRVVHKKPELVNRYIRQFIGGEKVE